jgi:hypothetical protein
VGAKKSPAQLVALVDLDTERIWFFRHSELDEAAQQKPGPRLHFFFYTDPTACPRRPNCMEADFDRCLIEKRIGELFG